MTATNARTMDVMGSPPNRGEDMRLEGGAKSRIAILQMDFTLRCTFKSSGGESIKGGGGSTWSLGIRCKKRECSPNGGSL